MASDAGCDAVKFQKRSIEKVYSQKTLDAPRESPWGTTQREQKAGLELSEKDYKIIDNYCRKNKFLGSYLVGIQKVKLKMRKFKTKLTKLHLQC